MYPSRPRTDGDVISSAPRVALRSTLGYLIMPRWGERSGYRSVLIAQCRRSKLWWVIRDGVFPMVLCPNGAQGDSPGQSEAPPWVWYATKVASPERAERTHGETNARCTHRGRAVGDMSTRWTCSADMGKKPPFLDTSMHRGGLRSVLRRG